MVGRLYAPAFLRPAYGMTKSGRRLAGAAALLGALFATDARFATEALGQDRGRNTIAVLRGPAKVTARVSTIEAPIGETVRFGTLRILAQTCRTRPPEAPPETTVFLEITDIKPGQTPVRLFTGWMFASSPALSALEHPVYDVWVIDCKTSAPLNSGLNE